MNADKNAQDMRPDMPLCKEPKPVAAGRKPERFSFLIIAVPALLLALLFALPFFRGAYTRLRSPGASAIAESGQAAEPWSEAWLAENPQLPAQQKRGSVAAIPDSGTLIPGDDDFMSYYELLYKDKERHYGRAIELAGIVMRDDDMGGDAFLIGRSLIWCCEDDADFVGYVAFGAGSLPEDGAALRVFGVLERRRYTDTERGKSFDVPAIRIRSMAAAHDFSVQVYPVSTALFGY